MTINIGLGRSFGRGPEEKRPTTITRHFLDNVPGSCLIETGGTKVLCAVTIDERVKAWRKGSGAGWITAEYAMLPAATAKRSSREHLTRKGRSMEIERLIGRSLRSAVDLGGLGGEVTLTVDCDVLQADGGTRTAAITGAWVALHDALAMWQDAGKIKASPIIDQVAAISVGQIDGRILLDLDYQEDSRAEVDLNLVMNARGEIIEIQGTGEQCSFARGKLDKMLDVATYGIDQLLEEQRRALEA